MEKYIIKKRLENVKDRKQLTGLLNDVKKDLTEYSIPFSIRTVCYYCNPKKEHRYRHFTIKKKTGGERPIDAPVRNLKWIQICLNEIFKAVYTPSQYAVGFAENRSIIDGARMHVGKKYVLNIDLKDFFTSIRQARVWARIQLPPFNFSRDVANAVAGICSIQMEDEENSTAEKKEYKYVLPQGAPTSPILTNAICDNLDRKLSRLAQRFGLNYTRYADDITFSSNHYVYRKTGKFFTALRDIIEKEGFKINEKKTRLQTRDVRQEVTGITVNDKVNVTKKYIKDLRNILYIWGRYGFNDANERFRPKYIADKGHVKDGYANMLNVLKGKFDFLKMVRGSHDLVFQRLNSKFNELYEKSKAEIGFIERIEFDEKQTDDSNTELPNKTSRIEYKEYHTYDKFISMFDSAFTIIKEDNSSNTGNTVYHAECVGEKRVEYIRISKSVCELIDTFWKEDMAQTEIDEKLKSTYIALTTSWWKDRKGKERSKEYWLMLKDKPKITATIGNNNEKVLQKLDETLEKLFSSGFDLNILTDGTK